MIQKFVDQFIQNKIELRELFKKLVETGESIDYACLMQKVIEFSDVDNEMDDRHITEINDGDYQGTLLYLIPEEGYQPDRYWFVKIGYGSCSGCDALEGALSGRNIKEKLDDLMSLALHIVQGLKELGGETV